jgi:hypothetical protein
LEFVKQPSNLVIRLATAADAQLLAELGARTFSETFAADNTPEDMAAYLAVSFGPTLQAAELAEPHSLFLIAEVEEPPAGMRSSSQGSGGRHEEQSQSSWCDCMQLNSGLVAGSARP